MTSPRGHWIAVAAIAGFAVLFVYAFIQLVGIQRALSSYSGENMLWTVAQAERETHRFIETVLAPQTGSGDNDHILRLAILRSRLKLMTDEPQRSYFQRVGHDGALAIVSRSVDGLSSLAARTEKPVWRDIAPLTQPLLVALGGLANAAVINERIDGGEQRDRQLRAIYLVMISIAGLLAAGGFLSWQLLASIRALDAANAALSHHKEQLETIVTERTAALTIALENERYTIDVYKNFLATVSHQFRTPMAIIDMIAQRFVRRPAEVSPRILVERAQRIRVAIKRLVLIIESTINSDMIEERGYSLAPAEFNLAELFANACHYHMDIYPQRPLSLSISHDAGTFRGDRTLIEQIVLNLLSNAEKYSPPLSPIEAAIRVEKNDYICTIKDYGIGIPADATSKIFDRFYRAKNVSHLSGSGLGLSLSATLARLHGGEISFSSDARIGTEFYLRLPRIGNQYE